MEIKKVNLDRQNLTSTYIEQKQDFQHVLKGAKMTKIPTWKSPWFYGAVGLSSVAILTMAVMNTNLTNETHDKNATLINTHPTKNTIKPIAEKKQRLEPKKLALNESTGAIKLAVNRNNPQIVQIVSVNNNVSEEVLESQEVAKKTISISEKEEINVKPTVKRIGQPSINGVSSGIISVERLKNSSIIESNSSFEIASYEVQYFNGRQDVIAQIRSNVLPNDLKEQIIANNVGEMIFITGIKGIDETGKLVKLPSINLKISK